MHLYNYIKLITIMTFFNNVNSASFGVYSDSKCENLVIPVLAYSDVCTWNTYSQSYSVYLDQCSTKELYVVTFNLTDSPTCASLNVNQSFVVKNTCEPTFDYYTKIIDVDSCYGVNNSYNIIAHNTPNCSDSGLPFTVMNNNSQCIRNSFGPGLSGASFDTKILQTNDIFLLDIFVSKNGTCQETLDTFGTKTFSSQCMSPFSGVDNSLFIQVWPSFPI